MVVDPPVTETIPPEAITKLKEYEEATKSAAEAEGKFGDVVSKVKSQMDNLTKGLTEASYEMEKTGRLTEAGAARFILFTNSAIGVKKAFEGLGGVSSTGLSTFGAQLASVKESLASGKTVAGDVAEKLKAGLLSMGVSQSAIGKAAQAGVDGLIKFSEQQITSADNAMKLSAAYVHQMAATGGLSKVATKAGDDFGNMNAVMAQQAKMLVTVGQSANKLPEQVEKAFGEFMKIPGAIDSVVDSSQNGGSALNGLTAIMKLADGTGRNFEDVNNDVSKAIKALTGDLDDSQKHMGTAMQFTQRFTEISSKFKISVDDVKGGLAGVTDSLMKYTNAGDSAFRMTEGVSGMMNEYVGGLMKAGMTGKQAIDSVNNMASAFGGLNTAQKAFLSAQTGGPGGLMGAAQIEKMIRTGDIEGVKKRVMEVMKKQFGSIVTQEDATKSEAAAGQYTRQKMLLQQGPLGQLAKSDTEAAQMLDMFSGKQKGTEQPVTALSKEGKGLADAINKGSKWEEKSAGFLARIVGTTDAMAKSAMFTNVNMMQSSMGTISSGNTRGEMKDQAAREASQRSRDYRDKATTAGGKEAQGAQREAGLTADKSSEHMKDAVVGGLALVKKAPADIGRAIAGDASLVGKALKGSPTPINEKEAMQQDAQNRIAAEQARQKTAGTAPTQSTQSPVSKAMGAAPLRPAQSLVSKGAMPSLDIKNFGQTTNPGAMVGEARRAPSAPRGAGGAGAVPSPVVTVEEAGTSRKFNVKVKVEVNDKETGDQVRSLNPSATGD